MKSGTLLVLVAALVGAQGAGARESASEDSFDGLHRVVDSILDEAWIRPDLDLGGYGKILIDPVSVSYRRQPTRSSSQRASSGRGNFALTEPQMEEFRNLFQSAVTSAMSDGDGWEVVERAHPEALRVHAELIDLVVSIPTRPSTGRQSYFAREIGEVTLVLELHDSQSGEILARAVDPRTIGSDRGQLSYTVAVTARRQVEQLFGDWARLLRARLDQIRELSSPAGTD